MTDTINKTTIKNLDVRGLVACSKIQPTKEDGKHYRPYLNFLCIDITAEGVFCVAVTGYILTVIKIGDSPENAGKQFFIPRTTAEKMKLQRPKSGEAENFTLEINDQRLSEFHMPEMSIMFNDCRYEIFTQDEVTSRNFPSWRKMLQPYDPNAQGNAVFDIKKLQTLQKVQDVYEKDYIKPMQNGSPEVPKACLVLFTEKVNGFAIIMPLHLNPTKKKKGYDVPEWYQNINKTAYDN